MAMPFGIAGESAVSTSRRLNRLQRWQEIT
jgi:hypothetical protein